MRHGQEHKAHLGREETGLGGALFGRGFGRSRQGWRGWEGRRGRGRVFDQGDLRFVILRLIAEKPSHGYELIKAIEESLGGAYSPSPGVVYPTLTLLEEMGYATVEPAEGGRKLYTITDSGRAHLEEHRKTVEGIAERMAEWRAHRGDLSPQVLRAMENLRTALRLRLARGGLSEEATQQLAQVLDDAARAVEST